MELKTLCENIRLPQEMTVQMDAFLRGCDMRQLEPLIEELRTPATALSGMEKLKEKYADAAPANIPLMTCLLLAAARNHAVYAEKGIPDQILYDTMGVVTRYCTECHDRTGCWYYDGSGWACRHAGMRLFRIGILEYEFVEREGERRVSVHIPAGVVLSQENLDASVNGAREFIARYFPEHRGEPFACHSWLLAPALRQMLGEDSGIRRFQDRFVSIREDAPPDDCVGYVFHVGADTPVCDYPEDTSLQRKIKALMLDGGHLNCGFGYMK